MTKNIPIVQGGIVIDDQTDGPVIRLETPAWFTWLEAPTTTRFSYALFNRARGFIDGFMTVRKEQRQRGTAYWSVYRRQGQRLCKVYVGPSAALTQARLEQIAAQLRPRAGPPPNPHFFVLNAANVWLTPSCTSYETPLLIVCPEVTALWENWPPKLHNVWRRQSRGLTEQAERQH